MVMGIPMRGALQALLSPKAFWWCAFLFLGVHIPLVWAAQKNNVWITNSSLGVLLAIMLCSLAHIIATTGHHPRRVIALIIMAVYIVLNVCGVVSFLRHAD